jgi:predicted ATPase
MFIAIVGTRGAGKSTVEDYLVSKGFTSVCLARKDLVEVSPAHVLCAIILSDKPPLHSLTLPHMQLMGRSYFKFSRDRLGTQMLPRGNLFSI